MINLSALWIFEASEERIIFTQVLGESIHSQSNGVTLTMNLIIEFTLWWWTHSCQPIYDLPPAVTFYR
jgi:hypothetical protein